MVNGIPPDLIVYFGDLLWRSVGSVGLNTIHTFENDTGPDDANHAQHGVFILAPPKRGRFQQISSRRKLGRTIENLHLMDVTPTVLKLLGVDVPEDMEGRVIE